VVRLHQSTTAAADDATSISAMQQGYNDFSAYREYLSEVLGTQNLGNQVIDVPIGWVSATLTPDGDLQMQFELPPAAEGITFGSDTIQYYTDLLENADPDFGTLNDVSYSVSNPGAVDFSFNTPDDDNYGDAVDQFRNEVASALDVYIDQVGDVIATFGSSKLSLQFQVLAENCTFAEGEVDRIETALQSGSLGEIDAIIYDSSDCGQMCSHIDAVLTTDNTNSDGSDAGEMNYFYALAAGSAGIDTTTGSGIEILSNSDRRLRRRLQQWSCDFDDECDSGYCASDGYCL